MDYGKIVNRAFQIAWRFKFLWFFGMFIAWDTFNLDFDYIIDKDEIDFSQFGDFQSFLHSDIIAPLAAGLVLGLLLWMMVMIIMSVISEGALIDSVNRIERNGQYGFGIAWSNGLNFFFRILGIGIINFIVAITYFGMTATAIVIGFIANKAIGIIILLFAIPLSFMAIFIITNMFSLSQRAAVIRDSSIGDSLYEGYYLLKNNFGKNFMIFLINLGLGIAFGILIALVMLMAGLPIGILLTQLGFTKMLAFTTAFVAALPLTFVFGGYTGTLQSSIFTLFYLELVIPKSESSEQIQPPPTGIQPAE